MLQRHNAQMVKSLATDFPRRNEPNYCWGNVIGGFLMTPQLRGLWPMSSTDENSNAFDVSGQGRTLTMYNNIWFYHEGLVPMAWLSSAGSQYFGRASEPGLVMDSYMTCWGWFKFHAPSMGVDVGLISKWYTPTNQRSFVLYKRPDNTISFAISSDGINITSDVNTVGFPVVQDKWYFCVGRFATATVNTVAIGEAYTGRFTEFHDVTAIPASLFASTAGLNIGRFDGANNYFDGFLSLVGLCRYPLADDMMMHMFQQSYPMLPG